MSEISPGQAAFAEYYGRQAGAALSMPESWAMQSDTGRADWDAAGKAAITAGAPAELAAATAETRQLRERIGRLLGLFGRGSAGCTARTSAVVLAREYRDAGLPVPAWLSHLEGQ